MNRLKASVRHLFAWHVVLLLLVLTGFALRVTKKSGWPKKDTFEQFCGIDEDDCDSDDDTSLWPFIPSENEESSGTESGFASIHPSVDQTCQVVTFKCPKWILHMQLKLGFTEV